jgi:hypothetical protein
MASGFLGRCSLAIPPVQEKFLRTQNSSLFEDTKLANLRGGYKKINTHKKCCISIQQQTKKEIKRTIPFMTASKRIPSMRMSSNPSAAKKIKIRNLGTEGR